MTPASSASSPLGGVALRLLATFLFALMALAVRLAATDGADGAPVGQIMFWRSAVALLPIVLYLAWRGQLRDGLKTRRPLGHARRSLLGGAAMFFSFLSLAHLPLALATALGFLAPLVAIPAAVLLLGERPRAAVILAAGLGFAGVALMLAPALAGPSLDWGAVIGIAAGLACALTTAGAKVEIKRLTATEAPAAIAFYFALFCALGGLATLPFGWVAAEGRTLLWLVLAGLAGGLAHIAMTEAIARAPVSTLAPFEYTAMIWAVLFDLAVFALAPSPVALSGAALVVGAAALVAWGEARGQGETAAPAYPAASPPVSAPMTAPVLARAPAPAGPAP